MAGLELHSSRFTQPPLTAILPAFANQYPYEVLGVREKPLADPVPSYRQIEFNSAKLRSKLKDGGIAKKLN